jgi:hypothetical protein
LVLLVFIASDAFADVAENYARAIKDQLKSTRVCSQYATMIDRIIQGGMPDRIQIIQIDKIVDSADRTGCINY